MSRGRPKGSGRWSAGADADVWGLITAIMRRDGKDDVRRAAGILANEGLEHVGRDRKVWTTNVPPWKRRTVAIDVGEPRPDARQENPAEVLRARYYAAARRQKRDAEYKMHCDDRAKRWTDVSRSYKPGRTFIIEAFVGADCESLPETAIQVIVGDLGTDRENVLRLSWHYPPNAKFVLDVGPGGRTKAFVQQG